MRACPVFGFLTVLFCSSLTIAADLYETSVIVTGMNMRERHDGLQQAVRQVLFKASGNPGWITDPRVDQIDPATLLVSIAYLDRESNLPKHDEQGTRDRPYDLVARFDPARVESTLRGAGDAPWPAPRPPLFVNLVITPRHAGPMTEHADTDPDEPHRGALLAAANRAGLDVILPLANPIQTGVTGFPLLQGTMRWSDEASGWVSSWTLRRGQSDDPATSSAWGVSGVGFDAAYRDAMEGVAKRLSGHGS